MAENKKYNVEVKGKVGSCDNALFEKMAKKGDITATKIAELLGEVVKITGYAYCEISIDEKTFNILYVDTEEYGLVSSSSEIFRESVEDYYGDIEYVRLTEVKTKKGKTYKAVPVLGKRENKEEKTTNKETETNEDLPF